MGRGKTNVTSSVAQEQEECKESESDSPCPPRVPDKGIRCAGQKRMSRLLWLHDFFRVYESARSKKQFLGYTGHCNSRLEHSCLKVL
jgi:hypothetical protein